MLLKTQKAYGLLPRNIRLFFTRALIVLTVWKVIYHFLLEPSGTVDNWLTIQLGRCTVWVLSFFYNNTAMTWTGYKAVIIANGQSVVSIAKYCNGLELMVFYMAVLLCIPTNVKRTLLFAIGGSAVIFLLNMIRCVLLTWMHFEHIPAYDFAHHYAFKFVVYFAAFYGWVLYLKTYGLYKR